MVRRLLMTSIAAAALTVGAAAMVAGPTGIADGGQHNTIVANLGGGNLLGLNGILGGGSEGGGGGGHHSGFRGGIQVNI